MRAVFALTAGLLARLFLCLDDPFADLDQPVSGLLAFDPGPVQVVHGHVCFGLLPGKILVCGEDLARRQEGPAKRREVQ